MIAEERRMQLERLFREAFGSATGTHLVLAPGRVNLIGEHTDYNGLPVFPIAIQRDIAILYRSRADNRVVLHDVNPCFSPREFEIEEVIPPFPPGDWGNYVKAAAQAVFSGFGPIAGLEGVISGEVPREAGLSSSSAMVVACSLAFIGANRLEYDPLHLMDLLAEGEKYVGTRGGGMDQAISLGGRKDVAVKIDFFPLRLTPTPVPPNWCFVIAHSLVQASKSAGVREKYNQRPVECRQALEGFNRSLQERPGGRTYSQLLDELGLHTLLSAAIDILSPVHMKRFRHVVCEGSRVEEARKAMLAADIGSFGQLMNESHRSLQIDFEVSCPELDELVETCREGGAVGARMTGAGFGGCAVALCERSESSSLCDHVEENFYKEKETPSGVSARLIVAKPSSGARLLY